MKRVLLILSACLLFAAAETRKPEGAHLALEHPTHDFGDVPRKGGDLVHEFRFTNLKTSYPKRPVAPGDSGVIRVVYEPHKSEPGVFNKVIQIYSNSADGRDIITVQGNSIDGERSGKAKERRNRTKTEH